MELKTLRDALEIADIHPEKVSRRRDGRFNVRSGYFYHNGRTAEGWAVNVKAALEAVGFAVEVEAHDEWAAWPKTSYLNAIVRVVAKPTTSVSAVADGFPPADPPKSALRDWVCVSCGQEVLSREYPTPIPWSDGHRCRFTERPRVAGKG